MMDGVLLLSVGLTGCHCVCPIEERLVVQAYHEHDQYTR